MGKQIEIGDTVRALHERGTYVVKGFNRDGSISVYGGANGYGSFRDFRPDRVRLVKAPIKRS